MSCERPRWHGGLTHSLLVTLPAAAAAAGVSRSKVREALQRGSERKTQASATRWAAAAAAAASKKVSEQGRSRWERLRRRESQQ